MQNGAGTGGESVMVGEDVYPYERTEGLHTQSIFRNLKAWLTAPSLYVHDMFDHLSFQCLPSPSLKRFFLLFLTLTVTPLPHCCKERPSGPISAPGD